MNQSSFSRIVFRMVLIVSVMLTVLYAGTQPSVRAQAPQGLFTAATDSSGVARPADANIVRSRLVSADLSQIANLSGDQTAERITFNLFDDVTYVAVRRESTQNGPGRFSWVGDLEGTAEGEITLAVDSGVMVAGIQDGQDFYEVRWAGNQRYHINVLSRNDTRDALEPLIPDASASVLPPVQSPKQQQAQTIDVMVLYTPSAREAAGGTDAMNALIDLAIADTNTAYANSDVAQRVRLVHKDEIDHTEQGFETDLKVLTYKAGSAQDPSGLLDSVHDLRDEHKADLVSLFINDSQACGLAWLMTSVSPSFESFAFSVVDYQCAVAPQNSFAHEMGHNMGLKHDKENAGGGGVVFPYAYGYRVSGQFRTVMAYNCSPSCPRVRHFSNPNVLYNGMPTGTTVDSSSPAYNALALDKTASTVASFREATEIYSTYVYVPMIER